jgi:hypothetical protein
VSSGLNYFCGTFTTIVDPGFLRHVSSASGDTYSFTRHILAIMARPKRAHNSSFLRKTVLCVLFIALFGTVLPGWAEANLHRYILYVGTYSVRGSRGIYAYSFDGDTGTPSPLGLKAESTNPS